MRQKLVRLSEINRPHQTPIDEAKVTRLMESIREIGLQEPIDLLEMEGKLYGFNGCHRFTAHKRLGLDTIKANIRQVDRATFRLHLL
ncbi:sulfiredoxin [Synechococcus sp. A10-1-5-9]|uniref:sulfiredoxin n=1 Tax=Synechococcus sp. A10-1-5-9 TaxID=3392295 RepID=UPI0039EB0998